MLLSMAVSKETPLSGVCCRLITGGSGSLSEWWAFQNKTLEPSGQQRQKCRAPGDFVGCITPLLSTRVYFRRACLSNHHMHLHSGQRLNSPKAAVHYAVPLELDFAAAPHILLETTDHFKAIIFKAVCVDPYWNVRVLHVQKLLALCFLYKCTLFRPVLSWFAYSLVLMAWFLLRRCFLCFFNKHGSTTSWLPLDVLLILRTFKSSRRKLRSLFIYHQGLHS